MSWLMSHDNLLGIGDAATRPGIAEGFFGQTHMPTSHSPKLSHKQQVIEFVSPRSSPIWKALADGCVLVDPGEEERIWSTLWHFTGGASSHWLRRLWSALLPLLARLSWKIGLRLDGWPYTLLLLLSSCQEERRAAAERWGRTRCRHCLGASLARLHDEFPTAEDCAKPEFLAVVNELGSQLDFSIFDVEIEHHLVRDHLDCGKGSAAGVESASVRHIARAAESYRLRSREKSMPKARGHRPAKGNRAEKRKFMSAFALYTEFRGCAAGCAAGIASGSHGRQIAEEWTTSGFIRNGAYPNKFFRTNPAAQKFIR